MKKHPTLIPLLVMVTLLAIVALSLATAPVTAGELPPRPATPTPPLPPPVTEPEGAPIILQPVGEETFPDGTWTVVQWQTALGDWVDVEGWQGHFNEWDTVVWWVGPEHFDESPFRWLVYESEARETLLATSDEFTLPEHNDHRVLVPVVVPDASDS